MKSICLIVVALLSAIVSAASADQYYSVSLSSVKVVEGTLPTGANQEPYRWQSWMTMNAIKPRLVLKEKGEGYVTCPGQPSSFNMPTCPTGERVVIRAEAPGDIHGSLFLRNGSSLTKVKFELNSPQSAPQAESEFRSGRLEYLNDLVNRNLPGAAWFRFLASDGASAPVAPNITNLNPRTSFESQGLDQSFALFTGGRAISESLQLERRLQQNAVELQPTVDLSTLQGITVKPYDWAPLLKESGAALVDSLAAYIPADQYALFFPSFAALSALLDELDNDSAPFLAAFESRFEDAMSKDRYQRQLCLPRDELSKIVGPLLIEEIAITGSDPYLRSGSDLSIIFKSNSPEVLRQFILAKQQLALGLSPSSQKVEGNIGGLAYSAVVSADRSTSSYLAVQGGAVIVSNSLPALGRILNSAAKPEGSYQALGEYKFFRSRYPKGDKDESALLVVSDDAIRKWCGPLWRIAASRRVHAEAYLADLEAQHLKEIVSASEIEKDLAAAKIPMELGKLTISNRGVRSSLYGSRGFLTPISELTITKVSSAESSGYTRWRDGYQQNWSTYFDPLALRLGLVANSLSADLSIMPLIIGSDYRTFVNLSEGVKLPATAGDPHLDSLFHFILALNSKSQWFHQAAGFTQGFMPSLTDPFSWIGNFVSLYADPDPFWKELANDKEQSRFLEAQYARLPIGLQIGVQDPLKVSLFLTALRGGVGQAAPGMMVWENFEHQGVPYVKVSSAPAMPGALPSPGGMPAIYYAVTPSALTVTLSEDLLKRSLDRRKAMEKDPQSVKGLEWLGESLGVRVSDQFTNTIQPLLGESSSAALQLSAWSSIPILNEWRRVFPDQDPLEVHRRYWHTALSGPGGSSYVWNEEWQTMESTMFGHPGQPKTAQNVTVLLAGFNAGEFGLSFINDGLRTKVNLTRAPS